MIMISILIRHTNLVINLSLIPGGTGIPTANTKYKTVCYANDFILFYTQLFSLFSFLRKKTEGIACGNVMRDGVV